MKSHIVMYMLSVKCYLTVKFCEWLLKLNIDEDSHFKRKVIICFMVTKHCFIFTQAINTEWDVFFVVVVV